MTATAFEEFLTHHKSCFVTFHGEPAETLHPDAPVDDQHINAAEIRLGVPLPASYKAFLRVCGSGGWCGDYVAPPEDVYPFDEDCGDMRVSLRSSTTSGASATTSR